MRRRALYRVLNNFTSFTSAFIGKSNVADGYALVRTLEVSPDGTNIYITSRSPEMIRQFSVDDPLDVTSGTGLTEVNAVSHSLSDPRFLRLSPDGTKLYFGLTKIVRWDLSTPWDLSTAVYHSQLTGTGTVYGGCFSEDGNRMFLCGSDSIMRQYNLSTPWDITTASVQPNTLTTNEDFIFLNDGKIGVNVNHTASHYDIWNFSTPYELSTGVLFEEKDFTGGITANNKLAMAKAENINRFYVGIIQQGSLNLI